ncbi:ABC transporter permease [Paenibacillus sp. CN-4]|uniref:ABC transporter permease n=1 Tax=Paenibacillus nanchangensis TaxID=3348343 RepID=UPI0039788E3F
MLYCEWLKFRRSPLYWALPAVSIFGPVLFLILRTGEGGTMSWADYLANNSLIYIAFLAVVWAAALSVQIGAREFMDHTASVLYTYPASRHSILLVKTGFAFLIVTASFLLEFTATYAASAIYKQQLMPAGILREELVKFAVSAFGQMALCALLLWVSQVARSFLIPILLSLPVMLSNIMLGLSHSPYFVYSPFQAVAAPYMANTYSVSKSLLSSGIVLAVSVALMMIHASKADVTD